MIRSVAVNLARTVFLFARSPSVVDADPYRFVRPENGVGPIQKGKFHGKLKRKQQQRLVVFQEQFIRTGIARRIAGLAIEQPIKRRAGWITARLAIR